MLFVDINGLVGVHVRRSKNEIDIVRFSSEDEIFDFPDEDKRTFFLIFSLLNSLICLSGARKQGPRLKLNFHRKK
jgi:hypothetical protein